MTASSGSQCSDSSSACTAAVSKPKPFLTAVKSQPGPGRREDWLSKGDYGRVPGYLVERQLQLAEQMAEEQVCNTLGCCHGDCLEIQVEIVHTRVLSGCKWQTDLCPLSLQYA